MNKNSINTNKLTYAQGELCFCKRVSFGGELNTKEGRPAIIISSTAFNNKDKVTVVFLTHGERVQPSSCTVKMDESCGYRYKNSYISIGEMTTVDKARLCDRVGVVSDRVLNDILAATGNYLWIKPTDDVKVMDLQDLIEEKDLEIANLKNLVIKLTNKLVNKEEEVE